MQYRMELERLLRESQELLARFREELATLPEGRLYRRVQNDRVYYGERIPRSGNRKKERRIGVTENAERLTQLLRKEYLLQALEILPFNIALLEQTLRKYSCFDPEALFANVKLRFPELDPSLFRSAGSHSETATWQSTEGGSSTFLPEHLIHTTLHDFRMRSKSELYIAQRLEFHGIPYRYEAPLPIPDLPFVPDFTILRPRDGQIFYWEHCGMVDHPEKRRHDIQKILRYEEYGIVPWRNLILTYDDELNALDARRIEAEIRARLL